VSQDGLGLYDTPPNRQEIRLALLLVGLLFTALVILSALPNTHLRQVDAFIPMVDAIMFVGDSVTATLFYTQAAVFRSRALTVLASGFAFEACMLVAHVLTFPGAFAPHGLLGAGVNTTAWIGIFWRAAPPIAVIFYVVLKRTESAEQLSSQLQTPRIAIGMLAAALLAAAAIVLVTYGQDVLPQLFSNSKDLNRINFSRANGVLITLLILALAAVFRTRKSLLDTWLLVALSGWLASALLNSQATARFTVSFYSQFGMLLFSHFVLMLALLAEANRLYARLALSTAARQRERDARLMSLDAVTAAIAHEVGQPLTAVGLNASAAVAWLTGAKPDVKKALTALLAVGEARQRTFDVIRSIRATFAKEPGRATEFSLNDLVIETASLLDRELAASKISLQLSLDQALPSIFADRVQIQRVLINLVTNAIESMRASANLPRRIAISSALMDGKDVLLQVSDTGTGIASEDMEHIFDAFFTTKTTGTGLGLPLCRSIVEDCGGRLWASQAEPHGANFHLRLPRSGMLAVSREGTHEVLSNLERSLNSLRQSESQELDDAITELQHVVNEVRVSLTPPKAPI
jgi:signal transduction histidine kinase